MIVNEPSLRGAARGVYIACHHSLATNQYVLYLLPHEPLELRNRNLIGTFYTTCTNIHFLATLVMEKEASNAKLELFKCHHTVLARVSVSAVQG